MQDYNDQEELTITQTCKTLWLEVQRGIFPSKASVNTAYMTYCTCDRKFTQKIDHQTNKVQKQNTKLRLEDYTALPDKKKRKEKLSTIHVHYALHNDSKSAII